MIKKPIVSSGLAMTSFGSNGSGGYGRLGPDVNAKNPGPLSALGHIRSPQYQQYSDRLATFACWPSDLCQRRGQLAEAGFYYTGFLDVVHCFACGGGLKNWDPENEPWIEHARWFPQCPFVNHVKGHEYINFVWRMTEESDEEEDAVVHSTFQLNNPMANEPDLRNELDPQLDQADEENAADLQEDVMVLEQDMQDCTRCYQKIEDPENGLKY